MEHLMTAVFKKSGTIVEKHLGVEILHAPDNVKVSRIVHKFVNLPENSKMKQIGVDKFELVTMDNGCKNLIMFGSGKEIASGSSIDNFNCIKEIIRNAITFAVHK